MEKPKWLQDIDDQLEKDLCSNCFAPESCKNDRKYNNGLVCDPYADKWVEKLRVSGIMIPQ